MWALRHNQHFCIILRGKDTEPCLDKEKSKYTAIYLIINVLEAKRATPKSFTRSGSRPILKKQWKQLGFVGVSTVMYGFLSEQKQLEQSNLNLQFLKVYKKQEEYLNDDFDVV